MPCRLLLLCIMKHLHIILLKHFYFVYGHWVSGKMENSMRMKVLWYYTISILPNIINTLSPSDIRGIPTLVFHHFHCIITCISSLLCYVSMDLLAEWFISFIGGSHVNELCIILMTSHSSAHNSLSGVRRIKLSHFYSPQLSKAV